ncbi:MAG: GNAT family N-acetyltransferase [Saccharofermentanales bacterium]
MEIVSVRSIRDYKKFIRRIYRHDPFFKDNKSGLIDIVCRPGGAFYRSTRQQMIAVTHDGQILCQCVLIRSSTSPDNMTVAFFEAAPDAAAAVDAMMAYAADAAKESGCIRLVVSLDGHYNYSVGFLKDGSDAFPSFGASYNPGYYHDYFAEGYDPVEYVSYYDSVEAVQARVDRSLPFVEGKTENLVLSCADFSIAGFAGTIRRYTELNNRIFGEHRFYYSRTEEEDIELFGAMRLLLRPENLIFAFVDGRAAGFILWYPDFNEFVAPGNGAGLSTYLQYKVLGRSIRRVKVVEIGVLPEFEGSGIILLLFAEALEMGRKRFPDLETVMTSWILESNYKSKRITGRFLKQPYQRYLAYEKKL